MDPRGKLAVITGGASGLGAALAAKLQAEGARTVVMDVHPPADAGSQFLACDITDAQAVEKALDGLDGAIGILANCAGIGGLGLIATPDAPGNAADFRRVLDVNLMGAMHVTRVVAHRMIGNALDGADGERGIIVNACSIASFEGQEAMGSYTASKAALAALTLVWARDLSRYAIRCVGVAPGFFDTPMTAHLPPDLVEELVDGAEFPKRAGRAEEFADAALFLIRNPYINAEVLRLDGGARPPARTRWTAPA